MMTDLTAVPTGDPHNEARQLADLGWRIVPIAPGKKTPHLDRWQHAATDDLELINNWWNGMYRGHGVGIRTGWIGDDCLFVLDVDTIAHGADGQDTLNTLTLLHGQLPDTVEAITGSGGRHLYFTAPTEIRNSAGALGPGLDIRGEGGFVVAPPTIHPNGTTYRWITSPHDTTVAAAPAWLISLATQAHPEREARQPVDHDGDRPGDVFARTVTWHQLLERDGWTHDGIGRDGEDRWTRPGKQTRDGISATTNYGGQDVLKVFTSNAPPLVAEETYTKLGYLATTQHHGDHTAAARALAAAGYGELKGTNLDALTVGAVAAEMEPVDDERARNPLAPYLVDWTAFWQAEHKAEWILEPLFAAGRAHALYAGAKTGKSYVCLAAVAALATGRKFLDHPGGDPQHVLYVDYEMTEEDVRDRLEEFGYGPADDLSHLHYAVLPSLPQLDTEAGGVALERSALAVQAAFVIIDTTGRAVNGDENDANTLQDFYMHTGIRLKRAGIGWARLDHAGKDSTKGQRGTSAKNDDVDVVWKLTRTDDGHLLEATHRRMSWVPEKIELAVGEGTDGVTTFKMRNGPSWPPGTKDVADLLDRLGVPLDMGERTLREKYEVGEVRRPELRAALKYRRMVPNLSVGITQNQVGAGLGAGQSDPNSGALVARPQEPLKTLDGAALARLAHPLPRSPGAAAPYVVGAAEAPELEIDLEDEETNPRII